MLKRKIEAQLELWREKHSGTALLVSGARQVWISQLADALNSANTAADIMTLITAAANVNLKPQHSAIFIDGVQAAPNLVTQIKYLVQEYPYDFIFSGSLLGVELENVGSYTILAYTHATLRNSAGPPVSPPMPLTW